MEHLLQGLYGVDAPGLKKLVQYFTVSKCSRRDAISIRAGKMLRKKLGF